MSSTSSTRSIRMRRYGTHWAHARSTDLVHWEHLPLAIWPSTEDGRDELLLRHGRVQQGTVSRSSCTPAPGRWGRDRVVPEPFEQWAAIGDDDLINWTKYPDNPALSHERDARPEFDWRWRDPFFFFEQGRSFMVLGATGVGHSDMGVRVGRSAQLDLPGPRLRHQPGMPKPLQARRRLGDAHVAVHPRRLLYRRLRHRHLPVHPPSERSDRADQDLLRHQHPV